MQQQEETSCALEKPVIPLKEEEKEANCVFTPEGGAHTHEKWKEVLSHLNINIKPLPTNDN